MRTGLLLLLNLPITVGIIAFVVTLFGGSGHAVIAGFAAAIRWALSPAVGSMAPSDQMLTANIVLTIWTIVGLAAALRRLSGK